MPGRPFTILTLWLCSLAQLSAQPDSVYSLDLIFAGDIMGHDSQIEAASLEADHLYDYSDCFRYVSPILKQYDLAIGNLELTLPGRPPYQGYPQFRSPDELALALRHAGFNVLVTANNHSNDAGPRGLAATLDALDNHHFLHTGTFRTAAERQAYYPLLIYRNQFKIALLNYTYGTNGIPTRKPTRVNLIDTATMHEDLVHTRQFAPDFTIVFLHWGKEYKTLESQEQRSLARWLIRMGADMVIGSHPHVVQPIRKEVVTDRLGQTREALVAYSLGNFISGQSRKHTNGGILLGVRLQKRVNQGDTYLADHRFIPCFRYRKRSGEGKWFYTVIPVTPYLENGPDGLNLSPSEREAMRDYRSHVRSVLSDDPEAEWLLTAGDLKRLRENALAK